MMAEFEAFSNSCAATRLRVALSGTILISTAMGYGEIRAADSFSDLSPGAAVAVDQFIRLFRSRRSGGIVGEAARRQRLPHLENRVHHGPAGFDHVRSLV